MRPEDGEVANADALFQLIKEMFALNNSKNGALTTSGDYVSGVDSFDKRCAFSMMGGGSVTDVKCLYMLCIWCDVQFVSTNVELAIGAGGGMAMGSNSFSSMDGETPSTSSSSSEAGVSSPVAVSANVSTTQRSTKRQVNVSRIDTILSQMGTMTQAMYNTLTQATPAPQALSGEKRARELELQYQKSTFIIQMALTHPHQTIFSAEQISDATAFMTTGSDSNESYGSSTSSSSRTRVEYPHRNVGTTSVVATPLPPLPRMSSAAAAGSAASPGPVTCAVTHVDCFSIRTYDCDDCGIPLCNAHRLTHYCD